jgi:hypothetical protein
MAPAPNLQELIDIVRQDAPSEDALDQLATASTTVAQLNDVGDALLGHYVDRARRSGRSWTEISTVLGVTKQAVHKRFATTAPSLERFTKRAQSVLQAATEIARFFGHSHVDTEHLLLSLFTESKSIAAKVLSESGVTSKAVQEALLARTPRRDTTSDGPVPYTARASAVVTSSVTEALQLGHNYVGTEHILLALYREPEDAAAQILGRLGLDRESAHARVVEALIGYGS